MGCSSIAVLLVNAGIDSMGEVVEGGVDVAGKASPQRAAIEKVQAELRQEYIVRDKRKRELEFLEKGGNPLDLLKPGNAAAVSVQSTSFTSQHPDQFITCEAKGSFAFNASPHGDSVDSSGRLGASPCEPNSADNLMLFDAEPGFSEGDKGSLHPTTNKIVPSEKLFQLDGIHSTRDHRDSAAFSLPRKAYRRRNRSRPNREGTRSSSTDVNHTRGSHGSSLPSRHGKDLNVLTSDNQCISTNCKSEPTCPTDGTLHKTELTDIQQDMELDGGKAVESIKNLHEGVAVEAGSDAIASDTLLAGQCIQQSDSVAVKTPVDMSADGTKAVLATEEMTAAMIGYQPTGPANNVEDQSTSCQINGVSSKKDGIKLDAHKTNASRGMKGLDSELSCNGTSINIGGSNAGKMLTKIRNADSNGKIDDQNLVPDEMSLLVEQKRETGVVDSCALNNTGSTSLFQSQQESGCKLQPEDELNRNGSAMKDVVIGQFVIERTEACKPSGLESEKKPDHTLDDNLGPRNETSCIVRNQDLIDTSISNFPEGGSLSKMSAVSLEAQTSSCCPKLEPEIDEESILKEAQIIEAKRKRIAELSVAPSPRQLRPKSHWDYVLEEMAWLANDFAQERVWKMAAAAQICFRAAFSGCLRQQKNSSNAEAKKIAHTLAKSVMGFWHSVEEKSRVLVEESQRDDTSSVKGYAVRFLKHNTSNVVLGKAEGPLTPDRVSDTGILDLSWEDKLTEENLFYTVPPGAIEAYRISVESHVAQFERIGSSAQEEVETSACDAMADFESQDTAYDEDEGEINTYDMSMAFEGSRSTGYGQKNQKHLIHAYGVTSCEVNSDILPMPYVERAVTQQSALLAKRPGGSFNVSIPTKRVRTASRRIISPFSAGTSGCIQVPNRTDASSGDTNSFQDDQSTLRGGSLAPHCLEVESASAFDKQFDSADGVTKHKKKKKAKYQNAAYEPRWQAGSTFQMEQFQRDNLKKSQRLDSNGNIDLFGQPVTKKPKIMRQSQDNFFDNVAAVGGSAPSPVASQMSNMSNPNKFIKLLGGRDRGRKPKVLKMPGGQSGSGSPWTLFEDQALVVLAHDLGPNWELVSDAINSTLQFKCIFRKAKECKERHNFLMDRTSGDGADSAEDSGSSQAYPSTLPGIPKGSARQLFQRLKGPMEEETLKSHFEKIIVIGQKQQYRKTKNDKQDPKQLQQPHSSHTVALSEVSPNNLNGGPVLTPLDLCDSTINGPEILPLGYQGQHPGGISNPNLSTVTQMHPASGASSALQGSPNLMVGNNMSSSPGSLNPSMRDVRYGVPRSASSLADEQQRMQQYNQIITCRNTTQANISSSGTLPGSDRGVRILPGGSGMGLACGVNRSMPLAKPGFQGLASSSIVNPAGMVSPGMPSANMHSGVGSGHGSSMLRPREALHMMRPGLSQDPQRQMMVPDIQMQVSPGNGQVPHFGGLSSAFPNQTASAPVSSYPLHHQPSHPISPHHTHVQGPPNHAPNPQHQAYAMRLAKERQQHRFQGQQPHFAASMPHVHSQPQLPISSPSQNSPQVPQAGSPPVTISPLTSVSSLNSRSQNQPKHQSPAQGVVRNAQAAGAGITNHTNKQRQRQQQQLSQGSRQHPQQRQQPQAQPPAKVVKGVGRGNLIVHQNPSLVNGVSASPGNQGSDKGETVTHVNPSQGLYTSPAVNTLPPTRQYVPPHSNNHSLPHQKNYSSQAASSSKHLNQKTSHSDSSSQGHVPAVNPVLSTGHQSVSSLAKAGQNFPKAPSHQKLANQNQLAHQRVQQNRQINLDPSNKPQARDSDADQRPTNSSAEMVATTISPQTSNPAANVAQVVSSTSTHQWHASEPLSGQNAVSSAVNLSASESMPSNSGESLVGPGPDRRPSSSSIPSSRKDVGAQLQQPPSQLQHAGSPVPQHQQHQQPLHSQQQGQLLQAEKGNLYGRSNDQNLEPD